MKEREMEEIKMMDVVKSITHELDSHPTCEHISAYTCIDIFVTCNSDYHMTSWHEGTRERKSRQENERENKWQRTRESSINPVCGRDTNIIC